MDAKQTYDSVLDLYESYFQDTVRFTEDGTQAAITGQEWFHDIETVGVNRERAKTQFIPYDNAEKKDREWLAKDYSGSDFQKEYVPAPWQKNIQEEDYKTPQERIQLVIIAPALHWMRGGRTAKSLSPFRVWNLPIICM